MNTERQLEVTDEDMDGQLNYMKDLVSLVTPSSIVYDSNIVIMFHT